MNGFVHNLPPQLVECVQKDLQGFLEIEVSHINFITLGLSDDDGKFSERNNKSYILNDTPNKNSKCDEENSVNFQNNRKKINEKNCENSGEKSNCVQVKIVWFGECCEDASNVVSISCEEQQNTQSETANCKLKTKNFQNFRKEKHKDQRRRRRQHFVVASSDNNKLRYRICTSGALFLDYLRSCKPIRIIVSSTSRGDSSSTTEPEPLGQAQLRLPSVLLRKFSFNIAKGHNFEHKTKIYTLYRQQQASFEEDLVDSSFRAVVKSGEIQLRFKMLFAPAGASVAVPMTTKNGGSVLHEKQQLTSSLHHHHLHHHHNCHHHPLNGKSKVAEHVVQGDKSKRLSSQSKSEEIVEAMKKLDAKLVAYLAGETEITSKIPNCEEENEANLNLENNNIAVHMDDLSPATKLNIFRSIRGIKLEMEALTLQSDGTKCMDLVQSEIRPIFTVECQLSNELIKNVPRYDKFHIMQFESEKFQSLTQCTRFGQEAERNVKLDLDENGNDVEINLGRIYFTVWWREPGTCLNELLGMGALELADLYNASLLEQCKRIEIQRRGRHLACLYFKITLQREMKSAMSTTGQMRRELFLPKQSSCDSGDEKSPQATDKQKMSSSDAAAQQQQQQQSPAAQCNLATDKTTTEKASAQNNNTNKLKTANFDDETTKIRLLKGFIYANEARHLEGIMQPHKFLICRRFWLDEPAAAKADEANKFNYQEQFSVINDEKFLQRVDKQYLHLELWHRMSSDDGNGNAEQHEVLPVGVVRIPLHQFFIAYRDAAITNHLCKGKLPVISIDSWAPIVNWETGAKIGELKCLLAVGSEEQIKNLKDTRGLSVTFNSSVAGSLLKKEHLHNLQPLQIASCSKNSHSSSSATIVPSHLSTNSTSAAVGGANKIKKTSDLLDMLQKVLMTPPSTSSQASAKALTTSTEISPHSPSPCTKALKPLLPSNVKLFKFALEVQKAIGLPLNPASKAKKGGAKQRNASKRFPPNEAPSTYVTFQADEGQYQTFKSHEGMVFATNIVEKSTQPQWQQRFRLAATIDYLNNPQKRFILKVWKKSALDIAQGRNQPTPMEDAIIGFAALDLTVFVRGLHIGGRFNIVDFNGRMNGQLEVRCQPLEDIPTTVVSSVATPAPVLGGRASLDVAEVEGITSSVDSVIDQFEQTLDLTHLNLGQAIKRKFTELEGISQRLRARLGDVTGTEIPNNFNLEQFDSWQPIEKEINDNDLDEFEHDLNTPTGEEEDEEAVGQGNSVKNSADRRKAQGNRENDDVRSSE